MIEEENQIAQVPCRALNNFRLEFPCLRTGFSKRFPKILRQVNSGRIRITSSAVAKFWQVKKGIQTQRSLKLGQNVH